jgi:hypothetical protein
MRLSREVPGTEHVDVYLDGEQLTCCLAADDATGEALCAVLGEDGRFIADRAAPYGVRTEIRRGVVTFAFPSEHLRHTVAQVARGYPVLWPEEAPC